MSLPVWNILQRIIQPWIAGLVAQPLQPLELEPRPRLAAATGERTSGCWASKAGDAGDAGATP